MRYLKLDRKQLHVSILPQELGHAAQVLVRMAKHIHDGQQLAEGHGELLGHPTLGADFAALLACGAAAAARHGSRQDFEVIHFRKRFLYSRQAANL